MNKDVSEIWHDLPRTLRDVVCMQRAPNDSETIQLIGLGLALQKPGGDYTYTKLGYDVRFHGFQENRRRVVN